MELEKLRISPDLRAVRRHIDGNIPDDGDPLPVGIGLEGHPLPLKLVLEEGLKIDFVRELPPRRLQRLRVPQPQRLLPSHKARAAMRLFQGHKQGVIREP